MFRADFVPRSNDAPLKQAERGLDRVRVNVAVRVLAGLIDRACTLRFRRDGSELPHISIVCYVEYVLWRIIMTSWRSKFFAMLLGLVAILALAGPLSAASKHHHRHKRPRHHHVR